MDAWNLQLRAQKEQERKKKTESEENLHGYRGVVTEEETKLAALRAEERRKQQETAEILHGYRGGVKEEDMKLAAIRQEDRRKQQDAERNLRSYRGQEIEGEGRERPVRKDQYPPVDPRHDVDPLANIAHGSVSAMAEKFDSPRKDKAVMLSVSSFSQQFQPGQQPLFHPPPIMQRTTSSSLTEPLGHETEMSFEDDTGAPSPSDIPPVVVPRNIFNTMEDTTVATTTSSSPTDTGMEPIVAAAEIPKSAPEIEAVVATEEKKDEHSEEQQLLHQQQTEAFHLTSTTTREEETNGFVSKLEEEPLHDHPTIVRLDVNFSFGLVTANEKPILDGYMMAVEEVVRNTISLDSSLSEHVSYNPTFGPFVQDFEWDGTFRDPDNRRNVKRALVTASVPVFLGNNTFIGRVRDDIVAALRASIQSGNFFELAQGRGCNTYFY